MVADVHMRRATAELVKRHQVDLKQRLPGRCCAGSRSKGGGANWLAELLRMQVLSLAQDNWMFESDEEG